MPAAAEEAADGNRPGLVGLLFGDANGSEAEDGIAELEAGGGVEVGSAGGLGGGEPEVVELLGECRHASGHDAYLHRCPPVQAVGSFGELHLTAEVGEAREASWRCFAGLAPGLWCCWRKGLQREVVPSGGVLLRLVAWWAPDC